MASGENFPVRGVDVVLTLMAGFLAVFVLAPAFCREWQEFSVACGAAALLSMLASRPRRLREPNGKPWSLVSRRPQSEKPWKLIR